MCSRHYLGTARENQRRPNVVVTLQIVRSCDGSTRSALPIHTTFVDRDSISRSKWRATVELFFSHEVQSFFVILKYAQDIGHAHNVNVDLGMYTGKIIYVSCLNKNINVGIFWNMFQ